MIDFPAGNVAFINYIMNTKDITFTTAALKTDLQFAFLTCQLVSPEVIIVWSY